MLTVEDRTLAKFQEGESMKGFFSKELGEIYRADMCAKNTFASSLCSSLDFSLFHGAL